MDTAKKLLELKKSACEIETLDNDDEAIVQLITVEGRYYPVINGNLMAIQAVIEAAYKLFPEFKEIIDEIANGKTVLSELKTNHLSK